MPRWQSTWTQAFRSGRGGRCCREATCHYLSPNGYGRGKSLSVEGLPIPALLQLLALPRILSRAVLLDRIDCNGGRGGASGELFHRRRGIRWRRGDSEATPMPLHPTKSKITNDPHEDHLPVLYYALTTSVSCNTHGTPLEFLRFFMLYVEIPHMT